MKDNETEPIDNNEEKKKLYMTVIQNIKKNLDSTSKLELDAQKATVNLQSKLGTKLKKESELTELFRTFKNQIIAKAISSNNKASNNGSGSNTTNTTLNESVLIEFEKEEEKKMKEIDVMRLSLIKTKMNVQKLEKKLKSKQKLDEELDILGFEQLQTENKTLKKKLDDRKKEVERYKNKFNTNCSTLTEIDERIKAVKKLIKENGVSIETVIQEISHRGRELSTLTNQYKDTQKLYKIQSTAASNKIVHDHFITSKEKIKNLKLTLENLKTTYNNLTCY